MKKTVFSGLLSVSGECDRCDPGDYMLPRVALLLKPDEENVLYAAVVDG